MPLAPAGSGGTAYTIQQLAKIWQVAGGSEHHWIDAVAVAVAESSGDPDAISPSHDYGLWQINRIHFGDGIITAGNWSDPETNAREAIRLSGNGTNWAAWCTAWVDPAGNCGHGHLPHPEAGSPAGRMLPAVAAVLGGVPLPMEKAASAAGRSRVGSAWSYLGWWLGTWNPDYASRNADVNYWSTNLRKA